MEQDCFRCDLEAQLQASGEIGGLRYFDAAEYSGEPAQVPGVLQVFDWLRDGLLDEPLPQSAEPARL